MLCGIIYCGNEVDSFITSTKHLLSESKARFGGAPSLTTPSNSLSGNDAFRVAMALIGWVLSAIMVPLAF